SRHCGGRCDGADRCDPARRLVADLSQHWQSAEALCRQRISSSSGNPGSERRPGADSVWRGRGHRHHLHGGDAMKKAERGATIAEAAVTALTLFTLILGVIDFGRAYSIYQNVTNAAREGARFAVAPDPTTLVLPTATEVQSHVTPFLTSGNISGTVDVSSTTH